MFYWLCEDCAAKMTLAFEQGYGNFRASSDSRTIGRGLDAANLRLYEFCVREYFRASAFQRMVRASVNMRRPSRRGLIRVPA